MTAAVVEDLAVRADTGAERTATIWAGAENPARDPERVLSERERLLAANDAAVGFFVEQYTGSWAPAYLEERLGTSLVGDRSRSLGYAPAGWAALTAHLRGAGFSDAEIVCAGLGVRASTGRVIDRFRDRLMFPISDRTGQRHR